MKLRSTFVSVLRRLGGALGLLVLLLGCVPRVAAQEIRFAQPGNGATNLNGIIRIDVDEDWHGAGWTWDGDPHVAIYNSHDELVEYGGAGRVTSANYDA